MLLRGNPDSEDDSISDAHSDDGVYPNNVVSLDTTNKQELPLQVRLDLLKGISNQHCSSFEKPLEDEVEMPEFGDGDVLGEVVANSSEEEIVFENEGDTILSTTLFQKYGSQFIRNDQVEDMKGNSEALLRFKDGASCSASHATCSKANTSGIWSKAKPRFSLPSVSQKCARIGTSISNIDMLPEIIKADDPKASANLDGNYLEDDSEMEIKSDNDPAETEALAYRFNQPSMADLLDNLQDKTDLCFPHDSQKRGKTVQLFQKNSRHHMQDTVVDSEESPEPVDSGSSSDNEVNDQHTKITFPANKMQTMADRFQEALGSSSVRTEGSHVGALNSLRAGLFGKLQQVMQREKERDSDFWKTLEAGARPDGELGCVDVKIISRYVDGKLTVCCCSFGKYTGNFLLQAEGMEFDGSEGGQRTIIFSPRVCDNVDLELGSSIRIHPPWKEVQVGNDNIILCTYFSQTSSLV